MRSLRWLGVGVALVAAFATAAAEARPQESLTRLVPPPEGQTYFGLTMRMYDTTDPAQRDTRPVDVRLSDAVASDLGGRAPTFFTVDAYFPRPPLPGEIPTNQIRTALTHSGSSLAVVNWQLGVSGAPCGYACYHGYTTVDVADGALDAYIRRAAVAYRRLRTPVLIWLMPDANSHNHPGLTAFGVTQLTPADYRAAWRHVVDVFRQEGANNVSFGWVVDGFARDGQPDPNVDHRIALYYPGDRYVDWIGTETFDRPPIGFLVPPYEFAVARGKPFAVAGFGLRSHLSWFDPADDVSYLSSLFDWFESHPDVRAIDYVDERNDGRATPQELASSVSLDGGQVSYTPWSPIDGYDAENDGRLLADDGVGRSAIFAGRIANPHYIATISTSPTTTRVSRARILRLSVGRLFASWSGDPVALVYDVEVRQVGHAWREVVKHSSETSEPLPALPAGRYQLRVRAYDVIGTRGPWSPLRAFRIAS